MVSQLSGERPNVLDNRNAISELMALLPFTIRLTVEGGTFNFVANSFVVMPNGSK